MVDMTGVMFVVTDVSYTRIPVIEFEFGTNIGTQSVPSKMTIEVIDTDGKIKVTDGPSKTFVAVPLPHTTAEHLAYSVFTGQNCGPQLVDCLLEMDVFDIEGEFAKKVRKDTIDEVLRIIYATEKYPCSYTRQDDGEMGASWHINSYDIIKVIKELA